MVCSLNGSERAVREACSRSNSRTGEGHAGTSVSALQTAASMSLPATSSLVFRERTRGWDSGWTLWECAALRMNATATCGLKIVRLAIWTTLYDHNNARRIWYPGTVQLVYLTLENQLFSHRAALVCCKALHLLSSSQMCWNIWRGKLVFVYPAILLVLDRRHSMFLKCLVDKPKSLSTYKDSQRIGKQKNCRCLTAH